MIDVKTFKKSFNGYFANKGFVQSDVSYCLVKKDFTIVLEIQRSNYSDGYYIGIGYVIHQLNPSLLKPTMTDGDIRARFTTAAGEKKTDLFTPGHLTSEAFYKDLEHNYGCYVDGIDFLQDLKTILQKMPVLLYQTKFTAKRILQLV